MAESSGLDTGTSFHFGFENKTLFVYPQLQLGSIQICPKQSYVLEVSIGRITPGGMDTWTREMMGCFENLSTLCSLLYNDAPKVYAVEQTFCQKHASSIVFVMEGKRNSMNIWFWFEYWKQRWYASSAFTEKFVCCWLIPKGSAALEFYRILATPRYFGMQYVMAYLQWIQHSMT